MVALLPGLLPSAHAGLVGITDVRTWSSPERTRLVLDLTGAPVYRIARRADPYRLEIDIKGGILKGEVREWATADGRVSGVTIRTTPKGARVTVALNHKVPYKHFSLAPYGNRKPHRIVVDVLGRPGKKKSARIQPKVVKPRHARAASEPLVTAISAPPLKPVSERFVVMVDPGHGGEDPGASGKGRRTREKDVVLQIARRLQKELNAMPGVTAYMTRDGDYFVSLGRRVRMANQKKADLFVSIHADVSKNRRTRGTHIYTLAPRTSHDRWAVRVAHMENASDLVGGVDAAARLPIVFDKNGEPNRLVESRLLAQLAEHQLSGLNSGGRHGRRSEARFWVLKGDRPSILVEAGFLSNRSDESALRSDSFQRKLAQRLAKAIGDYRRLRMNPRPFIYTAYRGDSLSRIARRFGVSIQALALANQLRVSDRLSAGQRLLIPGKGMSKPSVATARVASRSTATQAAPPPQTRKVATTRPRPAAAPARWHRVRRGENPSRIARRYGVRLADLMAANHLNRDSTLLVGQRLAIPVGRSGDQAYKVRAGDTLSGLAKRYRISLSKLAKANDLRVRSRLRKGQMLVIPGRSSSLSPALRYKVRSGDSLTSVAQRFGISISSLARANGLGVRSRLKLGQRLTIPGKGLRHPKPRVHVVRRGDSLTRIARLYATSVDRLRDENRLTGDRLLVGGRLKIPD